MEQEAAHGVVRLSAGTRQTEQGVAGYAGLVQSVHRPRVPRKLERSAGLGSEAGHEIRERWDFLAQGTQFRLKRSHLELVLPVAWIKRVDKAAGLRKSLAPRLHPVDRYLIIARHGGLEGSLSGSPQQFEFENAVGTANANGGVLCAGNERERNRIGSAQSRLSQRGRRAVRSDGLRAD